MPPVHRQILLWLHYSLWNIRRVFHSHFPSWVFWESQCTNKQRGAVVFQAHHSLWMPVQSHCLHSDDAICGDIVLALTELKASAYSSLFISPLPTTSNEIVPLARISRKLRLQTSRNFLHVLAYLWLWFSDSLLTTVQYVMRFRFCGCRQVFTYCTQRAM